MKSIKDNKLDSNKLCEKLIKNSINDKIPTLETSKFTNIFSKKIISHKGPPHWSIYRFAPSDRLGRLRRLRNISSAVDLRNLITNNRNSDSLSPCDNNFLSLSYCLCCGSPGHTIDQCNPNHSHLQYVKHDNEDGSNTSRSIIEGCKQLSIDINTHSRAPLSTSNDDLNNCTNLKNHFKSQKQHDTSCNQVALPLIKRNLKNKLKNSNDVIHQRNKEKSLLNLLDEQQLWGWQSKASQQPSLNKCCSKVFFSSKNEVITSKISKKNAQQGAQMCFPMQNLYKLNNSIVLVNNANERKKDKCETLLPSNMSSCLQVYPSSLNESSVAIIRGIVNGVETNILLDTGSSFSAITETFVQQLNLQTWLTRDTLVVTLANNHIEKYPERTCLVTLKIGDIETYEELNVLPNQIYNITLGKNWLKRNKVICDFGHDLLKLPNSRPIQMGSFATLEQLSMRKIIKEHKINSKKLHQKSVYKLLRF